jgi:hypothetical protein
MSVILLILALAFDLSLLRSLVLIDIAVKALQGKILDDPVNDVRSVFDFFKYIYLVNLYTPQLKLTI